ncbi:MAG: universal stress protein [Nitrososphaera sp.]|nr:universal stress protein [Nitrososphaera sp.]
MLSKILIPVDGSDNSFRALEHALLVAKSTGAQITAMHVIESPPTVYVQSQKLLDELLANYKRESAKILDKCEEIAEKSGVKLDTVIAEGDPATSITEYAKEGSFDLIVIGSRGLGKFKEMILGSTSSKVLHHTKSSVMVVR